MLEYLHDRKKFSSKGLQLDLPVDLIPPGQYSRLTNAVPKIEGELRTRDGLTQVANAIVANTDLHSVFRHNQRVASLNGERIVGIGTRLFSAPLPAGSTFTELTGVSFDGKPLSMLPFRYTNDPSSWTIIANANGMRKRKEGGFWQKLGLTPPGSGDAAIPSDNGAGNLDSDGGDGYDWRYTYVNEETRTESNPSPLRLTSGPDTVTPTDQDNSGYSNPANGRDGSDSTFANGSSGSATNLVYKTWGAAAGLYDDLTLKITWEVTTNGLAGSVGAFVLYSLDGGSTYTTIRALDSVALAKTTEEISLPARTDLSKLRVRFQLLSLLGPLVLTLNAYNVRTVGTLSSDTVNALTLSGGRQANVCVVAPTDAQETAIRLYRRGGTLTDNHYLVGEFPVSTLAVGGCSAGSLEISDNVADTGLGAAISLDNDEPVTSVDVLEQNLPVIWGPFDERVLGCGDPNRPEVVYFSNRGDAGAWGSANFIEVSDPSDEMMNGVVYNNRSYAFSRERMYELVPNLIGGITLTPNPTPCDRGLIGRWALVVSDFIYFVSKDGIYVTSGGPKQSITDGSIQPLFPTQDGPGRDVNGLEAVDMTQESDIRLMHHNDELWFTYKGVTTGTRQILVYCISKRRWRAVTYTPEIVAQFSEQGTTSSLLLGGTDGSLYSAGGNDDNGTAIAVTITTGSHDQDQPLNLKEYGNVLFDLDPNGATITITPLINGEVTTRTALTVTGTGRQQVSLDLGDVYAYNIEFQITYSKTSGVAPLLYQYDIQYRYEPISTKHWELPETSHGLPGFFHLRDVYVALRSTAAVTLTVVFDGTSQTYTIASTSGARRKVRVEMKANKGKVYQYKLDSSANFQVYQEDCEVRAKPWLSSLGYQVLRPLGGER